MRFFSRFKTSKRTNKFLNFWTMSAAESQKVAEDGQNKENLSDFWGIVPQMRLAFFYGSRNKKSFLI